MQKGNVPKTVKGHKMFKAVLFDLDGVITDTAEYHYLAWLALVKKLGYTIDRNFNESLKGVSREESLRRILKHLKISHQVNNELFRKLAAEKNDLYVQMIQKISPADIYPGILELLKELKSHHIRIALASASKNGPFLLKQMGLTSYFDIIVDPAKIKENKPAPDIFIAAAEGVGVNISETIAIEDTEAGIVAIKAAGAFPIGVGKADVLGNDIILVSETNELTYDFLLNSWKKNKGQLFSFLIFLNTFCYFDISWNYYC